MEGGTMTMAPIERPVKSRPQADERSSERMGTRVYVGNLPFDTDASALRALFEEGGRRVADVKIITDRDTGRPRGFAFVEMENQSDAQAAIQALNGRDVGGRALTVNEAKEQAPRRSGGGGGGGGYRSGGGGGGGRRPRGY
ncbi:MAG: RNA-binding protein [bacterium]|uniref:RNA-binding protein n=2 Tax=Candidatus Methylomirabilis TaxID=1170227 RepID=A0AAJ1EHW4_9BACT|nr:RNA-binding protein [Candidatus Methylomirabilis sp.]